MTIRNVKESDLQNIKALLHDFNISDEFFDNLYDSSSFISELSFVLENEEKIIGLMISNALVALSGALVTQSQGYADVGMGTGTIVIGLASVIIGEVVFGNRFSFWYKLASVVMGSIIYRIIIAIVLQLGLKATDLKLLTAIIVAIALSVPVLNRKVTRVVGCKRKGWRRNNSNAS